MSRYGWRNSVLLGVTNSNFTDVSTLAELKAAFAVAEGGTGLVTAARIKFTADISGLDVVLSARNQREIDFNGYSLTMTTGGNFMVSRFARESAGSIAGWASSGGVFTITGSGTSFNNLAATAGRAEVFGCFYGGKKYFYLVKSIDSATQITVWQDPILYMGATNTISNGNWWFDQVTDDLVMANGVLDFNSQNVIASYTGVRVAMNDMTWRNIGDGTSATDAFVRFGHLAAGVKLLRPRFRNIRFAGTLPAIDIGYSRDVVLIDPQLESVRINTASGDSYGIAFNSSHGCRVIGGRVESVVNAGNGWVRGISDYSDCHDNRVVGCDVFGVRNNAANAVGIYMEGAKDTVTGCNVQQCNVNSIFTNGTKSGNQEG